jgi:glycerol kinase
MSYILAFVRTKITETTALGAAYLAGLAVGFWKDKSELSAHRQIDKIFTPQISTAKRKALRERGNEAIKRAINWKV